MDESKKEHLCTLWELFRSSPDGSYEVFFCTFLSGLNYMKRKINTYEFTEEYKTKRFIGGMFDFAQKWSRRQSDGIRIHVSRCISFKDTASFTIFPHI